MSLILLHQQGLEASERSSHFPMVTQKGSFQWTACELLFPLHHITFLAIVVFFYQAFDVHDLLLWELQKIERDLFCFHAKIVRIFALGVEWNPLWSFLSPKQLCRFPNSGDLHPSLEVRRYILPGPLLPVLPHGILQTEARRVNARWSAVSLRLHISMVHHNFKINC